MVHGWRLHGTQIDRTRFYDPFNMQHTKKATHKIYQIICLLYCLS